MTTFLSQAQIESRAAEVYRGHLLEPGFEPELLLDQLGLGLLWEEVDEDESEGKVLGQLIPASQLVVLNARHREALEAKGGRLRRFTLGHEIGHWVLHSRGEGLGSNPLFDGQRIRCRDSSREMIERQAERFSAALLINADAVREALPAAQWTGWASVYRLAEKFGVNATPLIIRLEELGCAHRKDGVPFSGPEIGPGQGSFFD